MYEYILDILYNINRIQIDDQKNRKQVNKMNKMFKELTGPGTTCTTY